MGTLWVLGGCGRAGSLLAHRARPVLVPCVSCGHPSASVSVSNPVAVPHVCRDRGRPAPRSHQVPPWLPLLSKSLAVGCPLAKYLVSK